MSKYTPTTGSDSRAAISALVLEAMGDAWSDSEEYSALPGVVADLLLTSDWLAAEKAKWQAKERERIAAAIDDLEHDGEEARRLVRTGEREVAWIDGYARAVFDAARIARQGGSDDER